MARAAGHTVDVIVVPVHDGRVIAFDVSAREARGRWLPWDRLAEGASPWEAAAALCDAWCGGPPRSLELADAVAGADGILRLIFRARLAEVPQGDDARTPVPAACDDATIRPPFPAGDLERWAGGGGEAVEGGAAPRTGLIF